MQTAEIRCLRFVSAPGQKLSARLFCMFLVIGENRLTTKEKSRKGGSP